MILALDYDGTYTLDPALWLAFVSAARQQGHEVFCCTMRTPEEVESMCPQLRSLVQVIPTSREAKSRYLAQMNIKVDVWIDDCPMFVVADAADRPRERPAASTNVLGAAPKAKARMTLPKSSQGGFCRVGFLPKIAVAVSFLYLGLSFGCNPRDNTDPVDGRSGMHLYVDAATGCNYLSARGGALSPRLRADGSHWCDVPAQRAQ